MGGQRVDFHHMCAGSSQERYLHMHSRSSLSVSWWLFLFVLIVACLTRRALAWNDRGHMVVARLVWLKLTPQQRTAVVEILKHHPHYQEFLSADRPNNVSEEEWVFWRAATWSDWVKNHHTHEFSHPTWHYINLPFIPPGSSENPADHEPPEVNVVAKLKECIEKAKSGPPDKRAVNLCWTLHLAGDMGQPLHCATLFSEEFPDGNRGGNAARYRFSDGRIIKLHSFWDGLLGRSTSANAIRSSGHDAQQVANQHHALIAHDLQTNTTVDSWRRRLLHSRQSMPTSMAPLFLRMKPTIPRRTTSPKVPDRYADNAGMVARLGVVKAGERLATTLQGILD